MTRCSTPCVYRRTPTGSSPNTPDLDEGLRHIAKRLDAGVDIAIDVDGRLHAAKIEAIADRRP